MFNRFVKSARQVAEEAGRTANGLGSPTVEAEHVLLAVARTDVAARHLLAEAGLEEEGLLDALEAEERISLAAIGLSSADVETRFSPWCTAPRWSTSGKRVMEGALRVAAARGDNRIVPAHILVSALSATRGTVPRALDAAGVDRAALAERAAAEIDT